jgi:high-affinity nickel-transport protein
LGSDSGLGLSRNEKIKLVTIYAVLAVVTALALSGSFWYWLNALDFERIGFGMVAIFIVSWLVSLGYWRYRKLGKLFSLNQSPQLHSTP